MELLERQVYFVGAGLALAEFPDICPLGEVEGSGG